MVSFAQSMKRFRLLFLAVAAALGFCVLALVVGFNASFQTWAARRVIAQQPGLKVGIGEVSAGRNRVALKELRYEQAGAVLTVPFVEMDLPVFAAAMNKRVSVSRLIAKGWTLDLSQGAPVPVTAAATATTLGDGRGGAQGSTGSLPVPQSAVQAFAGVFGQLQLPADFALDGLQLEGDVILPSGRGRVKVTLTGGGLGAGRTGKFDVLAQATLAEANVSVVEVRAGLTASMDTARTFSGLAVQFDAAARGAQFPRGVKLAGDVSALRAAAGESYRVAMVADGQPILDVTAEWPRGEKTLRGAWKINVRDLDLVPFTLGRLLPAFAVVGAGLFDTDAAFSQIHATGRLNATVDRLQVLQPELAALGELKIAGEFDVAGGSGKIAVRTFEANVASNAPVAHVRALQPFEFALKNGELHASDSSSELFGVVLQGVPIGWAQPFLKEIVVTGGFLRGELAANARGGGITLRSVVPLQLEQVSVAQAGRSLVERVDILLNASADYTPRGWQTEVGAFTVKSGLNTLITLEVRAGQLAGKDEALKATGKLTLALPALLAQPALTGSLALTAGEGTIEFVASMNETKAIQAKVHLPNLATMVDTKPVLLPAIGLEIRADIAADGKITFNAPIVLERNGRKSDLTVVGSIGAEKDKVRAIDAQLTSALLIVDDAQLFAGLAPAKADSKVDAKGKPPRDAAAPWAGVHGAVKLGLQRVVYSDNFEVNNVSGRIQIDSGMVKLEGLQAGLREGGRMNVSGAVTFAPAEPQPYVLMADIAVKQFEVAPLFRAIDGTRPATVEGKFDLASKLGARASHFADLGPRVSGELQLTSRGGVFRGLPVNVSTLVDPTSKLSGWIASAGTAIGAIAGKKDNGDIANKTQAVAEVAKALNWIPYDQLSVVLARDAALNTTLKDFSLISPEVRLTGGGTARHHTGTGLLEDSLAMEFKLRARGRPGDVLKYLGVLETQPDDFGYFASTLPLKISGTLAKVETPELNAKLVSLALEKSGVSDKAADLVNKIFGAGK